MGEYTKLVEETLKEGSLKNNNVDDFFKKISKTLGASFKPSKLKPEDVVKYKSDLDGTYAVVYDYKGKSNDVGKVSTLFDKKLEGGLSELFFNSVFKYEGLEVSKDDSENIIIVCKILDGKINSYDYAD